MLRFGGVNVNTFVGGGMQRSHKSIHREFEPLASPESVKLKIRYLKDLMRRVLSEIETLENSPDLDSDRAFSLREAVRCFEIDLIKVALQRTGGHQRRAAELLGVKAKTLSMKIKLYRLLPKVPSPALDGKSAYFSVVKRSD